LFYLILFAGTAYLLASHGQLLRRRTVSDLYRLFIRDGVLSASLRAMGRYLKPSFHPWQIDDYGLADPILSSYAAAAQPEPAEDLVAPSDTARAA
jgi:predicted metal-dependent hydrolase